MGGFFESVAGFLTHPLTLALGGFAAFCLLVLWGLNNVRVGKPRPWRPTGTPWLNAVFAAAIGLSPILAVLFVAVLAMLAMVGWHIFASGMIAEDPDNLRWYVLSFVALLTALGGIIGTPLAIVRIWNSERLTSTQEEALFNEKINAAAQGLAARRQVTRVVGHGASQRVLTEWHDDLVSRNAAIDQLEGLVHERAEAADRIASLLSFYVVELSQQDENKPDAAPPGPTPDELRAWAWDLTRRRSDVEIAAQTLGRLRQIKGVQLQDGRIDLRRANLQAFDLRDADFRKSRLDGAHLEGANLGRALLERTYLRGAHLEGAFLGHARLKGTFLRGAHLEGASLASAQLEGAFLGRTHLEGANLWDARLDQFTTLTDAVLRRARVRDASWESVKISQDQVNSIFGDASVALPPDIARPDHWPDTDLGWEEFDDEYQNWLANPASYTPPQNRS